MRLSPGEHAALDGAAVSAGVETGGLLKAAAMRGLAAAVADLEAGRLRVRARSGRPEAREQVARAVREERPLALPVRDRLPAEHPAVVARRAAGLL